MRTFYVCFLWYKIISDLIRNVYAGFQIWNGFVKQMVFFNFTKIFGVSVPAFPNLFWKSCFHIYRKLLAHFSVLHLVSKESPKQNSRVSSGIVPITPKMLYKPTIASPLESHSLVRTLYGFQL